MDKPDQIQASDKRRARRKKLYEALNARIDALEVEIPKQLEALRKSRESLARLRDLSKSGQPVDAIIAERSREIDEQNTLLDSLLKEFAALEGSLERREAQRWRVRTFLLGLASGIGLAVLRWMFDRP